MTQRSPDLEHAAAHMRQLRTLYAHQLRDTRRADCAKHAALAQEDYQQVAAALDIEGPDDAEILNSVGRRAALFARLQRTAPY